MVKILGIVVLCLLALYAVVSVVGLVTRIIMQKKLRKQSIEDSRLGGETGIDVQPDVESADDNME